MMASASAEEVHGEARVVDGDTLVIAGERIRMQGIDAPEARQKCEDASGFLYPCGQVATQALKNAIDGRRVTCEGYERGHYRRMIATCYVGSCDLNGWMVRQGHATAERPYKFHEQTARENARGIWQGRFIAPPPVAAGVAPINRGGPI